MRTSSSVLPRSCYPTTRPVGQKVRFSLSAAHRNRSGDTSGDSSGRTIAFGETLDRQEAREELKTALLLLFAPPLCK